MRNNKQWDLMMFFVKLMLISTLMAFSMKHCNAQIVSNNGEFKYSYVAKNTLVTSLGDTIYTGYNFPVVMSDLGHPYNVTRYGGRDIKIIFSAPWNADNTIFVEYNKDGTLKQSLLFYSSDDGISYCYYSRSEGKLGLIKNNNYTKALSLWVNN